MRVVVDIANRFQSVRRSIPNVRQREQEHPVLREKVTIGLRRPASPPGFRTGAAPTADAAGRLTHAAPDDMAPLSQELSRDTAFTAADAP